MAALDANTGNITWEANVTGRARGLAVANGRLFVSTDRGTIHVFQSATSVPPNAFVRGDANDNGLIEIGDAVAMLFHVYVGAATLDCPDSGDVDDSGRVLIGDAIYLLTYLFMDGVAPSAPFPLPGVDPTPNDPYTCGD